MRFRFGWRKDRKKQGQSDEALSDETQSNEPEHLPHDDNAPNMIIVNGRTAQEVTMTTRIIFLGDKEDVGNLYSLFLRSKGYEVHHFPSPSTCALITQKLCTCPRDHLCADIIIAELDMDGMSGLELFRHQTEKGCHALLRNKAIISSKFTNRQEYEARALGCKILRKPFRLLDIMAWIQECEKNIPADRKLTPLQVLVEVA